MTWADSAQAARVDWEERAVSRHIAGPAGQQAPEGADGQLPADLPAGLPAPANLRAEPGRGQVTLRWDPVPGTVGYLIHRASDQDGPYLPLDHGGGDVLAVPAGPYADTRPSPGEVTYYAVASAAEVDVLGPLSTPVAAAPEADGPAAVTVTVSDEVTRELPRTWEPMIGSEHLSFLLRRELSGGQVIGDELREALRLARDTFGVRAVRAHGILCDDLGVYREIDGRPVYDFSGIDRVYDELMGLGLRPVVELSFMPADLAADPGKTVFSYGAIVSPPRDWDRWAELIRQVVTHLVERYGLDEVREHWWFEVWNEPNLEVFWSGSKEEYLRLYDCTAVAVESVDLELKVGGPASAASGWVGDLLEHVESSGAPLDFVSTHVYGNVPLDLRPLLARHGRAGVPLWWTEWGSTPTHFNRVGDTVFAAAFLLRGMRSALGRLEGLAHWVASDHFEELGAPPELFHGGFGLLSVGNLRKPRFWALALLAGMGREELGVELSGDGAGGLVEAIAARGEDGQIRVLVWNLTLDQAHMDGYPLLDREIRLRVAVPPGTSAGGPAEVPVGGPAGVASDGTAGVASDGRTGVAYTMTHHRIDAAHSNIVAVWERLRGDASRPDALWPEAAELEILRGENTLDELFPAVRVVADEGALEVSFSLPMPGVSCLEFTPDLG